MLSAEASLEEKDKRLARSSFVVDKRGLEEGQHRLLSENVRKAFRIEGGGRGVKPIRNALRLEKNCELMRCSLRGRP